MSVRVTLCLLVVAGVLSGCQSLHPEYPRMTSTAFSDHDETSVGGRLVELAARHPGKSGFALVRHGRAAFTARVALTALAEKSLDVQYYIWEADSTGRILAERLIRAADRGVRVRILLDDINLKGRDAVVAAMNAHPNVEIRLFNPFVYRGLPGLDFVTDFNRVNHRMHNKVMVMDNALAILGGRNIGNHYFDVHAESNFRDLDLAAGGPVVREISAVFDHFWNGTWSVPISALVDRPYTDDDLLATMQTVRRHIAEDPYPYPLDQDIAELMAGLNDIFDSFIWAPGAVVWDDPAAALGKGRTSKITEALYRRVTSLQQELLVESAYFVPRERALKKFKELHDKGVRVRILTNSLASNDVVAAHAGYAKHREELVAIGLELHELHPYPGPVDKEIIAGTSKAALHTKTVVFDRKDVFVGSFNLDPRSGDLNTEVGLYVESPALAAQVIAYMDEGIHPENSYRVIMNEGELYWETASEGLKVRYDKDPQSTLWQRFLVGLIKLLPVENQL